MTSDGRRTAAQWLRSQSTGEREMPRAEREKVARYYSKVLSAVLSAFDDGRPAQDSEEKPAKIPSRTYIEFVLSALGFEVIEWTRMGDDELVRLNTCAVRMTDDAAHSHALNRIQKQRERMNQWQAEAGNPILVEHRVVYDQDERRNYSEYKVPLGELLRDIITEAPVGTRDHQLKQAIKRHVRAYLQRFEGTAKPARPQRHPSPISDAHRSATLALKAFEGEERKAGPTSAVNLVRASFRAAFGDKFSEIFGQTFGGDNSQQSQENSPNFAVDKCQLCGAPKPLINSTTCSKSESAENFDAEDGLERGVL